MYYFVYCILGNRKWSFLTTSIYVYHFFLTGDPIFCLMDMGVWWPGFVLGVCANGVVSVAFWNENSM